MRTKRPIHLNILAVRMPVTAIASILHRISGVILFLCIPLGVWALAHSTHSPDAFAALQNCFTSLYGRIVISAIALAFIYHFLAGIRHLCMDIHLGESLEAARRSVAFLVLGMLGAGAFLGYWIVGGI